VGAALTLVLHFGYILVGPNFRTILPGVAYRSAQLSYAELERAVRQQGIRTIINLRGCCAPAPWYLEECRAANHLGVSEEDLGFSSGRLPAVPTLHQLLEVLDRAEYPILIHCQRGADRTGMVSAVILLLHTDTPLPEARRQLGLRYGHLPVGRTSHIDRFFDLYEEYLEQKGLTHSPSVFRRWARYDYCPGECRANICLVAPAQGPVRPDRERPTGVRVRCFNTSVKPWVFQPGSNAGIHAHFLLLGPDSRVVGEGKAGLFEAEVQPGEHIDLTLALPPLEGPGQYTLRVDLVDEQHGWFLQLGNDPLFCPVEVP
jgi:protein tyrosine/serine phosphatase